MMNEPEVLALVATWQARAGQAATQYNWELWKLYCDWIDTAEMILEVPRGRRHADGRIPFPGFATRGQAS